MTFPGINRLFTSPARDCDSHQKWIDFVFRFWHAECVFKLSKKAFFNAYISWCKLNFYQCRQDNIDEIHEFAKSCVTVMPKTDISKTLIQQAVLQLNSVCECLSALSSQMIQIAQRLPEYSLVHSLYCVGKHSCLSAYCWNRWCQTFPKKEFFSSFCRSRISSQSIRYYWSKKGSSHLRKMLFQIMDCYIKTAPLDEPIYQFLDRKRIEGKHYYCYMTAGSAKFLRIYYAKVSQILNSSVWFYFSSDSKFFFAVFFVMPIFFYLCYFFAWLLLAGLMISYNYKFLLWCM